MWEVFICHDIIMKWTNHFQNISSGNGLFHADVSKLPDWQHTSPHRVAVIWNSLLGDIILMFTDLTSFPQLYWPYFIIIFCNIWIKLNRIQILLGPKFYLCDHSKMLLNSQNYWPVIYNMCICWNLVVRNEIASKCFFHQFVFSSEKNPRWNGSHHLISLTPCSPEFKLDGNSILQ